MSDASEEPWSNRPNAPQVPFDLYIAEKEYFAGGLIGMITYGIALALFFQCMSSLLGPANTIRRAIKWALVAHTTALFSFLTIPILIDVYYLFLEYINNREFPGGDEYPPGPFGYDVLLSTKPTATFFDVTFPLNQWLADGLLLHRCYVIYSMNHWAVAFPCLMYLATVVIGIINIWDQSGKGVLTASEANVALSYLSICLSLNVLLTLMIVARLVVHIRNVRKATGTSDGSSGLHTTTAAVITMLIESYAIYAATLLLYIVPLAVGSSALGLFNGLIPTVQVIAPYLIILRVAKRRALTGESISGATESMRFRSQWSTDGDGSLPDEEPINSTELNNEVTGEVAAGSENAIEEVPF